MITNSLIEGRLREGTPESGASAVPARGFAIRSRAIRTPPGRHKDRPARSSLDWRMGNAGRSASGHRPRKRGPELKPVGGNPADGKAAAKRRKAGAFRKDAPPRLARTMVGMRLSALRLPQFSGRPQLSVVVRGILRLGRLGAARMAAHPINKNARRSGPVIRKWVTLARCYSDILRFWTTCANKKCRRSRRCLDRSGKCWNVRYPRTGPGRERFRARVVLKRRSLPCGAARMATSARSRR